MRVLPFFLFLFIFLSGQRAAAQGANFVWAQRFGGNLNDNCWSACDQAGNVYRMQGGIAKHTSSGSPVWTFTTPFFPVTITFDAVGDLYVVGYYTNTIDLDHGPGIFTVTPVGSYDMAIIKYSQSTGDFIWGGSMGSANNDNDATLYTDPSGNIFLGGSFTGIYDVDPGAAVLNFTTAAGSTDFFVSKLSSGGTLQWAKQFSGNATSWVGSIDPDPSGDIYISGYFSGSLDFDPGIAANTLSTSSSSDNDMYIAKLDALGNLVWVKQMGSAGNDFIRALEIGSNGNLYCAGVFTGLVDFDAGSGTLSLNSGTATNAFIAEYSSAGTPNWVKQYAGFYITAMDIDSYNGICITGQFKSGDFDPGPGTFSMTSNGVTWPDIYISKLNSSGDFMWAKKIGSINEDGPNTISIDGSNNIHVAGRFKTTCDFDPNSGYYPLTANGGNFNYDGFMLKLCQTPDPSWVAGSSSVCEGASETYSVNAVPNALSYTWTIPSGWTGSSSTNSITVTTGSTGGDLTVKAGNSCGASPTTTFAVALDICQTVKEEFLATENLYPNPGNGLVYLELDKNYQMGIYNNLGQKVVDSSVAQGRNILDLSSLPRGIYFIQLSQEAHRKCLKLILQ